MRWVPFLTALSLLVVACGPPPSSQTLSEPRMEPGAGGGSIDPSAIWFDVLEVTPQAPGLGRVDLAEEAETLTSLWQESNLAGDPPEVPFGEQVVLVYWKPEDACPDDLVEVLLRDAVLTPTFLPPPGGCEEPLIPTAYAVALHRADLPQELTVRVAEHEGHGGDVERTFSLPPYDGPPAPPPNTPPRQPDPSEIDAIFAGHPLRRCEELPDFRTQATIDGPLAEDEEVARAQQGRAAMGLPSDEATVRALLADPGADTSFGFPMTREEHDEVMARNRLDLHEALEPYRAEHRDTYGFTLIDQPAGGVYVLGFTDDVDGHRMRLRDRFPDAPIRVVEAPATQPEIEAAQQSLTELMRSDARPRIATGAGGPYLTVMLIDPTREDLDTIAELADPAFTCVDVTLSGLPPTEG
jgi:hypothetical protein